MKEKYPSPAALVPTTRAIQHISANNARYPEYQCQQRAIQHISANNVYKMTVEAVLYVIGTYLLLSYYHLGVAGNIGSITTTVNIAGNVGTFNCLGSSCTFY